MNSFIFIYLIYNLFIVLIGGHQALIGNAQSKILQGIVLWAVIEYYEKVQKKRFFRVSNIYYYCQ